MTQTSHIDKLENWCSLLFAKNEQTNFSPFKEMAWNRLQKIGFPTKSSEAFQYVSLRKLNESLESLELISQPSFSAIDIDSFILEESRESVIVLKDGVFSPELSSIPSCLIVYSLEEALKSPYGSFLKHRIQLLIQEEEDPFALLNASLSQGGVFIYVPSKTVLKMPLQILHVQTQKNRPYLGSRVHCFLGSQANIQIVSSFKHIFDECSSTLCNDFFDVSLEEQATVSHTLCTEGDYKFWGFSSFRASLKKESSLHSFFATLGSFGFRRDYFVSLLGERSTVHLNGLTALRSSFESHVHVKVDHRAPYCTSHQFFKNVLGERSRSSFTGKIHVKRAAQKTEAYQLNQNLLLSDFATANTKPSLEIFADDVKASHGATVSQIDEEQLFYLKTRGISSLEAKSLLLIGFCAEVLDKIPVPSLREKMVFLCRFFFSDQK